MSVEKLVQDTKELSINMSIDWLLNKIQDRYRWPFRYHCGQPTVEIILENGDKTDDLFYQDGYLNSDLVLDYYEKGYTVLLSKVQTLHPDIIKLARILNEYCNSEVNMNIYLGKGTASVSFPTHTHAYAVLVKSVQGESEWVIGGRNLVVKNQDVVYFDAEVEHEVVRIASPKLTITCNLE